MYFQVILQDNIEGLRVDVSPDASGRITLNPEDVPQNATAIELHDDFFTAGTGEEGFLLTPSYTGTSDAAYTTFLPREDSEQVFHDLSMPFYASAKPNRLVMALAESMEFEFDLVAGVKNGTYYMYPRFLLDSGFYEPIVIHFVEFTGADANLGAVSRYYRDKVLRKRCQPLRERIQDSPVLRNALLGPKVRIRMAWKPCPPVVTEQDPKIPQPIHCALTFDRVRDIIDGFQKAGIDAADICLVGWNLGGHDGQYPDLLPVEPACGGEEALKALNAYAASKGYPIGAHTNNHDTYSSASTFQMHDMQRGKDGNVLLGGKWCGGQSRFICPKIANEKYLKRDMEILKSLGFTGTHYFDVTALLVQSACFHPDHPLNRKQSSQCRCESFAMARKYFGSSSSEGCLPYAIGALDYGLYMLWNPLKPGTASGIFDHSYPIRFIAEHGLVHYNCYSMTINAPLKDDPAAALLNLAMGGQPCFYFYSKFREISPWGNTDLTADTPEALARSIEIIRQEYLRYKQFRDLQLLFIQDIRKTADTIETIYEDGTRTLFNASATESHTWNDGFVSPPLSLARIAPDGTTKTIVTTK